MIIGLCRTVAAFGLVVLVGGLAGCGGGTTAGSRDLASVGSGQGAGPAVATPAVEAAQPGVQREEFPAELVGVWLHAKEHSPELIEFAPTGEFRTRLAVGTAVVRGSTMVMQVDGQAPMTVGWSLQGGVLELGNMVYLRDDRGPGTPSIVGYWIKTDGFGSIRFDTDGSFELVNEANTATTGAYELQGNQLVLASRTRPSTAYIITLDDGLTVADGSGRPLAHYTRAG